MSRKSSQVKQNESRSEESSGAYIALLRGINVGGKNRLPMKDLAAVFQQAGCADVRTYIQSGNVVFRATAALARRVPVLVKTAIAESFHLDVPVMTRTAAELESVTRNNPFLPRVVDIRWLHVAFLLDHPSEAGIAALDPGRSPPDEFLVHGREIYLHLPHGMGRSKLTAQYFDSRLKTISTARNWNTVLKLRELTAGTP